MLSRKSIKSKRTLRTQKKLQQKLLKRAKKVKSRKNQLFKQMMRKTSMSSPRISKKRLRSGLRVAHGKE